MSEKNKKTLLLCVLFVAVLAAGYVNYLVTAGAGMGGETQQASAGTPQEAEETVTDVFATFRQEREDARAQELKYIESVINSAEADETVKAQAQEQKLAIASNMEHELNIEGLILTKLSTDSVVTVKDGAVNVVVGKKELSDSEVAQIAEIVKTQTGEQAQNIKIMPQV